MLNHKKILCSAMSDKIHLHKGVLCKLQHRRVQNSYKSYKLCIITFNLM